MLTGLRAVWTTMSSAAKVGFIVVVVLILVGCAAVSGLIGRSTASKTETVVQTQVVEIPGPTQIVIQTQVVEVPGPTQIVEVTPAVAPTAIPPSISGAPTAMPPVGACAKHGTVAWQNDNQVSGAVYGEAPVGGLAEPCGIVAQTWTDRNGTERFFFYVPPYSVAWISGHLGGTGWYFDPSQNVLENLQRQAQEIEQRDGPMQTTIAVLSGQTFRLVTRFQSASGAPTAIPAAAVAGTCNEPATGPAIIEYGDPSNGKATVLKLNAGQTSTKYGGGCFPLESQVALDARWPDHKAEFLAKYPTGQALEK